MKIEHAALWTKNLERMKEFYETYFKATSGVLYVNEKKEFRSCFLKFDAGARLELMERPNIVSSKKSPEQEVYGYAHIAISVGSEEKVNELAKTLKKDGYAILDGPRHTGDGYYEAVISDPDGNRLEITK